jgi:hypothetical protein
MEGESNTIWEMKKSHESKVRTFNVILEIRVSYLQGTYIKSHTRTTLLKS